jgi:hypothetical protein
MQRASKTKQKGGGSILKCMRQGMTGGVRSVLDSEMAERSRSLGFMKHLRPRGVVFDCSFSLARQWE